MVVRRIAGAALIAVCCVSAPLRPSAQQAPASETVPAERVQAHQQYRDARFGMFIHWGVYSLLGQGEWVMQNRPIAVPDYEWLASTFNPVKFDARAWVTLAKRTGMKHITITSRHHDGFAVLGTRPES